MKVFDMNGMEILHGDKIRIHGGMGKVYEVYKIVDNRYGIALIFYKDLYNRNAGMSAPERCIVILEDPQSFIKRVPL